MEYRKNLKLLRVDVPKSQFFKKENKRRLPKFNYKHLNIKDVIFQCNKNKISKMLEIIKS